MNDQSDYKMGAKLIASYQKNPFSADMWSKANSNNAKLFKRIKAIANTQNTGIDIQRKDVEQLGKIYRESSIAFDFINRNPNSATAATN